MDALSAAKLLLRLLRAEILRLRKELNRQRRLSDRSLDASGEIAALEQELADLHRRDVDRRNAMRTLRLQVCALENQLAAADDTDSKTCVPIRPVASGCVTDGAYGEDEHTDQAPLWATIEELRSAHKARLELLDGELCKAIEGRLNAEDQLGESKQELAATVTALEAEVESRELLQDKLKRLEDSNVPPSPIVGAEDGCLATLELQEVWEANAALEARTRQLTEDRLHAEFAAATARQALQTAEQRASASTGLMRIASAELSATSGRLSARETDCVMLTQRNTVLSRDNARLSRRMSAERLHLEAMESLERMARTSGEMLRKVEIAQAILTPQ